MRYSDMAERDRVVREMYARLHSAYGRQNWWPAESRFEVIVGAILTQNTSWKNVEKAMAELRRARRLSVAGIRRTPTTGLERLVRSSGYFRQKARRLKNFVRWLDRAYGGSLARMFAQPTDKLRAELLALNGIGPETADSILLYAGGHPVFVVDAYTRRVLERHRLARRKAKYEQVRAMMEATLGNAVAPGECTSLPMHPASRMSRARPSGAAGIYHDMHALIVRVGYDHCKKVAECAGCPLEPLLPVKTARACL
jgi:endonuclease III related protein